MSHRGLREYVGVPGARKHFPFVREPAKRDGTASRARGGAHMGRTCAWRGSPWSRHAEAHIGAWTRCGLPHKRKRPGADQPRAVNNDLAKSLQSSLEDLE